MKTIEWDDIEPLDADSYVEHEFKAKAKSRKRKWREIETIKERRRLRKELEQYDSYQY